MSANPRPVSVWVVACLYLLAGCAGFVYHFPDLLQPDGIWVFLIEGLAVVAGIFLLRGRNWARWLAVAWMAFHVVISAGDNVKLMIHSCLLGLIAWLLFRADATRYFGGVKAQE